MPSPLPFWKVFVLAIIQGVTEFLPISSDGHLLVAAAFLSPDGGVEGMELSDLTIVLHLGTLVSIIVFYWQRVRLLLSEDRRTGIMLVVGTIPAVVLGLPMKVFAEKTILENTQLAGWMLIATGLLLIWASRQAAGTGDYREIPLRSVLWIGLAQAFALLPGLSRSGMTISSGLRLGLSPKSAATFSFLLAIPAVGGAVALQIVIMLRKSEMVTPVGDLIFGAGVSFVVGLITLSILVRMLERGKLQWFAAWCIPLGVAVVVWQLTRTGP